jgi:hypothetical protein
MLLGQLAAVEVEDLPGLVKYLLGSATKANAEQASTHKPLLRLYRSLPVIPGLCLQLRRLLVIPACLNSAACQLDMKPVGIALVLCCIVP